MPLITRSIKINKLEAPYINIIDRISKELLEKFPVETHIHGLGLTFALNGEYFFDHPLDLHTKSNSFRTALLKYLADNGFELDHSCQRFDNFKNDQWSLNIHTHYNYFNTSEYLRVCNFNFDYVCLAGDNLIYSDKYLEDLKTREIRYNSFSNSTEIMRKLTYLMSKGYNVSNNCLHDLMKAISGIGRGDIDYYQEIYDAELKPVDFAKTYSDSKRSLISARPSAAKKTPNRLPVREALDEGLNGVPINRIRPAVPINNEADLEPEINRLNGMINDFAAVNNPAAPEPVVQEAVYNNYQVYAAGQEVRFAYNNDYADIAVRPAFREAVAALRGRR
jgi:hypothetical protein